MQDKKNVIPVYLLAMESACPDPFAGYAKALASVEELPALIRQQSIHATPSILLLLAPAWQSSLLETCLRLRPLMKDAWLGVMVILEQAASVAEQQQLREAGCLDVLSTGDERSADFAARLSLVEQLLWERHRRIRQEQDFRQKLAERRVMEARLNYVAEHDELTDLANRGAFERALDRALLSGKTRRITHAVLYLDLDRFKFHNDATGHGAGNLLLQHVANRLRQVLPPEYLLARLGSDEFAVLLQGSDEREARALAEQLRLQVAQIEPDGEQVVYHVAVSIGVALIQPGAVHGAGQALAQAEQACSIAKGRGGNCVHHFSLEDEALQHLREDLHWAGPIRAAIAESRLFLSFQPILNVADGAIHHFEALVRIPAALGGNEQSAQFMLAAERLGLAPQIDRWVVSTAMDYLSRHDGISLGINLSSHAFQMPGLLSLIDEGLQRQVIDPERLTFEITETAAIMNVAATGEMVAGIRERGCRFALDDFGSGFSSYHYLKHFPVDMLKIDGSFVREMRQDRRDQAIVQSMIDIGHSLDKEVVAEFVEDADTLQQLIRMGINHAQGYYIGRPERVPQVREFHSEHDKEKLP